MTDEMTDEMEAKAKECRNAFKAAMEAIQDYCGIAPTHEFSFPDVIYELATSDKSVIERIEDVRHHGWTGEQAEKICSKHLYRREGDRQKCVGNEADVIARGIVAIIEADGRAEAERKYAEAYPGALE